MNRLLIFGFGYTGRAIGEAARALGWEVAATTRDASPGRSPFTLVPFDAADDAIASATHIVATAPPRDDGDPVLARHADAIARAPALRWIGYLSTTGIYGDRGGGWVDETTEPDPASPRAARRIGAEAAWSAFATGGRAIDLIRLAGIYGPGRSVLDDVRAGAARPIRAPGHAFGRIHRDDIAGGTIAAIATAAPGRRARVLNFSDDEPAESADVIAHAAALLGLPPPAERTLEEAWPTMSAMARSFWSDNRRVRSVLTQQRLERTWRHPTYREGLAAIVASEQVLDRDHQDLDVGHP